MNTLREELRKEELGMDTGSKQRKINKQKSENYVRKLYQR
jgi:hypothetical protein